MHVGIVSFPGVLQMDLTGPYGIFAAMPGAVLDLVWKDKKPLVSSDQLVLTPTLSFCECPPLDVICVPGGDGILPLLEDVLVLDFIREQGASSQYVCSVCTGALVIAASGLLTGYEATTHWQSFEMLAEFGAIPVSKRVVIDRNRVSAAGVSAGIDMALMLAGKLCGHDVAGEIELLMEYDPQPPFGCGHPSVASKEMVERLEERGAKRQRARLEAIRKAAKRL